MAMTKVSVQPSVDKPPRKGSIRYCELETKIHGGAPFTRKITVNGRPYYQRCQWIYQDGKRKLKMLEHLGPRKPRAKGVNDHENAL